MKKPIDCIRDCPLVSIVVPVYNMESWLERCVNSILNQTFTDFEAILVDDGSTDRSPEICDQYAEKNSRISVIHKANGGLSDARAAGFDVAKGKYLLFVDSDDYIHKDMLCHMIDSMERWQADLTMCGYYEKREGKEKPVFPLYNTEMIQGQETIMEKYTKSLFGSVGHEPHLPGFVWLRMMKRELIERSFFVSEREYFMEDHVFDLLYVDCVQKISIVHEPLYYYCINGNSLTNRYRAQKWKMFMNLYSFYVSYIEKRGIHGCEERLDAFLLSAFCSSVDNAVLSGTYKCYKDELKMIAESSLAKKLKAPSSINGVAMTHRLTYFLFRFHFFFLLYLIRKNRLSHYSL